MPPNATEKDKPKFEAAADAAQNAQNIVLPSGSTVSRAAETRGQNPFLDFCNYQAKQILILATGGTLATLAEGDTGTLAGNAQENVWKQIVARDGTVISDALNRALFRPYLREAFPGRPIAVDFELGDEKTLTAAEVFDLAAKAKSAGWRIAQDELEEASGFTLERDEGNGEPGMGNGVPFFARSRSQFPVPRSPSTQTPFKTRETAFKNAPRDLDGQVHPPSVPPSQIAKNRASGESSTDVRSQTGQSDAESALKALSKDTSEVAKLVRELMEDPTPERAAEAIRRIPGMLPDDLELTAVFRDAIAEAYIEAAEV